VVFFHVAGANLCANPSCIAAFPVLGGIEPIPRIGNGALGSCTLAPLARPRVGAEEPLPLPVPLTGPRRRDMR
jgi:hypothetical protein